MFGKWAGFARPDWLGRTVFDPAFAPQAGSGHSAGPGVGRHCGRDCLRNVQCPGDGQGEIRGGCGSATNPLTHLVNRTLLSLTALVIVAGGLWLGGFVVGSKWCAPQLMRPTDDLDWLRMEFQLEDAQMGRIKELHEGYLPICQGYCDQIADAKHKLASLTNRVGESPDQVEPVLQRIAALRAQCQAAMLRHFEEVSQVMPPEQGRRYLAEMKRLTLGSHEQVEKSMMHQGSEGHGGH